jgi:hypothetical protein
MQHTKHSKLPGPDKVTSGLKADLQLRLARKMLRVIVDGAPTQEVARLLELRVPENYDDPILQPIAPSAMSAAAAAAQPAAATAAALGALGFASSSGSSHYGGGAVKGNSFPTVGVLGSTLGAGSSSSSGTLGGWASTTGAPAPQVLLLLVIAVMIAVDMAALC